MTCLTIQSTHMLAVLGIYSQVALPTNLARNIAFERMTSTRHEKWIPRRWLMSIAMSDSTMTFCLLFETTSLIYSRIVLASSSSTDCPVIWENVSPHMLPAWFLVMTPTLPRSEDEIQVASQFLLYHHLQLNCFSSYLT